MTITSLSNDVRIASPGPDSKQDNLFRRLRINQQLELRVGERVGEQRFCVSLGNSSHVVETHLKLTPGSVIRATVVAVSDKLELRYVDEQASIANAEDSERSLENIERTAQQNLLVDLANECAVQLDDSEQKEIADAMTAAPEPKLMAAAGLFLAKLEQPVTQEALQAIYVAQSWSSAAPIHSRPGAAVPNDARIEITDPEDAEEAGDALATAFEIASDAAQEEGLSVHVDVGDRDDEERRRLAQELLNEQDLGSVVYRYGTVPLLLGDRLVELDVVMFRERESKSNQTAVRKLVMTLETESFGKVEVMAQATGERLTISVGSESAGGVAALASYADDVRALVARLGWQVDAVRYDINANPIRAAERVVRHVLSAGTVDRMF